MKQETVIQHYTGTENAANCVKGMIDHGWLVSSTAIHIDEHSNDERINDNCRYVVFYVKETKGGKCKGCLFYGTLDRLSVCFNCHDDSNYKGK